MTTGISKSRMAEIFMEEIEKGDPGKVVAWLGLDGNNPQSNAAILQSIMDALPDKAWVLMEKVQGGDWLPICFSDGGEEEAKSALYQVYPELKGLPWIPFAGQWITNNLSRLKNPPQDGVTQWRAIPKKDFNV